MANSSKETESLHLMCGSCHYYRQDDLFVLWGTCDKEEPDSQGMKYLHDYDELACDNYCFIS